LDVTDLFEYFAFFVLNKADPSDPVAG